MLPAWGPNVPKLPEQVIATPDLGLLGQFNLFGSFQVIGVIATVLAIFSLMLSDFFDTMGTAFGLATEADLLDEQGNIPKFESILVGGLRCLPGLLRDPPDRVAPRGQVARSPSRARGLVASYSAAMSPRARRIVTLVVLIGLVGAVFVAAIGPR